MHYWYLWVIGLILLPVVALLPQINNIRAIIELKDKNPKDIVKYFLNPATLIITIIGGVGTFVCFILFFTSIIFAIIEFIKS